VHAPIRLDDHRRAEADRRSQPGDDRARARLEAAVLDLLEEETDPPALSQLAA
jgi:hypothetical protein